jgi:hypothetical protein
MKKTCLILALCAVCAVSLFALSACKPALSTGVAGGDSKTPGIEQSAPGQTGDILPPDEQTSALPHPTPLDADDPDPIPGKKIPSDPYIAVFQDLYDSDPGLNDALKYIAVDLTLAQYDTANFLTWMRSYCAVNGLTLLENTYDELVASGLIVLEGGSFPVFTDGILISFDDKSVTDTKLVTAAQKYRTGLGAIGAEYTVTRDENWIWSIEKLGAQWIS